MTQATMYSTGDFRVFAQTVEAGMQFQCGGHLYEVMESDIIGWKYYKVEFLVDGKYDYSSYAQARPARKVS